MTIKFIDEPLPVFYCKSIDVRILLHSAYVHRLPGGGLHIRRSA